MNNAMLTIEIYRYNGTWCFTDDLRGLVHEPFVLGMPEIIDEVTQSQCGGPPHTSYRVLFSADPFPTAYGYLKYLNPECNGAWYELQADEQTDKTPRKPLQGWLCPATLKFFKDFPPSIYVKVEKVG